MPQSPYPNNAYTVGWISALPLEMAAAKGMLDEVHGNPQSPNSRSDDNSYLLGSIGGHKIAVACLPMREVGPSSAALVATNMLSTFSNIRFGLMVGIGGGIPNYGAGEERDIRLGDVISSDSTTGGVVAYNFGKVLADGSFEVCYHLIRPPRLLRSALNRMDTDHMTRDNYIADHIRTMLEKYPRMRSIGFGYPQHENDVFFEADYLHVGGSSCARCNPARAVASRPERHDRNPVIHYGIIATGSSVIKHAPTRQEIMEKHNASCIEMEAAGLMNHFPCLVIRGISDYADSHKNDGWQPYAAATAAACAKELLGYVPAREVVESRTVREVLAQGL